MRYFFDTEFYERPGHIDLISIGIVREDGASFYAENKAFSWDRMNYLAGEATIEADTPKWILENVKPHLRGGLYLMDVPSMRRQLAKFFDGDENPEFWAWYGNYDWVVFCWIWGRMIDLPQNFPMYCRDFRQTVQALGIRGKDLAEQPGQSHDALADAQWLFDAFKVFEQRYWSDAMPVMNVLK